MSGRGQAVRALVLGGVIAALLLAGCGDDKSESEVRQEVAKVEAEAHKQRLDALTEVRLAEAKRRREHPGQVLAPAKFRGENEMRYETDREICTALSPAELADTLKVDDDSDLEAIATAYSKTFPPRYRPASSAGCLAGLETH